MEVSKKQEVLILEDPNFRGPKIRRLIRTEGVNVPTLNLTKTSCHLCAQTEFSRNAVYLRSAGTTSSRN